MKLKIKDEFDNSTIRIMLKGSKTTIDLDDMTDPKLLNILHKECDGKYTEKPVPKKKQISEKYINSTKEDTKDDNDSEGLD